MLSSLPVTTMVDHIAASGELITRTLTASPTAKMVKPIKSLLNKPLATIEAADIMSLPLLIASATKNPSLPIDLSLMTVTSLKPLRVPLDPISPSR
jgi:hypothetical protein